MAFTVAFLEASLVFAAVCLVMLAQAHPSLLEGVGAPAIVAPALAVSLCCLVSFYSNDLYELRALRDVRGMAPRLLQSLGLTFLLVAATYSLLPGVEVSTPLLLSVFVLVGGLVMSVRAVSSGIVARRAPAHRVLILGTGTLARKIAQEIASAQDPKYAVVGMVDDGNGQEAFVGAPSRTCARKGRRIAHRDIRQDEKR